MKSVIISVIVPIYNAEKHLPACINSILLQTFRDFELLLINDASKDNSLVICNQYANKDNRIIVFNQKKNGGECVSRNVGIDNAKGKYIVCIDADDRVLENHLESLYLSSKIPSGTLIHAPNLTSINGFCSEKSRSNKSYYIKNLLKNDKNKFDFLFAGPAWSKLIETEIIKSNNIRFRHGVKINGDHIFHLEYLMYIKEYINVGVESYIYSNNPESISKKHFSFDECFERVQLMIPMTKSVLERFNVHDNLIQRNLYSTPINALISSIYALYRFPFKKRKIDRIDCLNMVLGNYSNYLKDYWLPKDLQNNVVKIALKFSNIYLMDFCLGIIVFIKYSFLIKIPRS
jgi:glycosyltransferase involved in cell wall biosynthesis